MNRTVATPRATSALCAGVDDTPRDGTAGDCAWMSGLLLAQRSAHERAPLIADLLMQAEKSEPVAAREIVEDLIQHLELTAEPLRSRLAQAYLGHKAEIKPDCSCILSAGAEADRIEARLEPFPTRHKRTEYASAATRTGSFKIAIVIPRFLTAPTFLQPPLCALLAATTLRERGHPVEVIDNRVHGHSLAALADRVDDCDFVAVVTTPYDHIQNYFLDYRLRYALRTADAIKAARPRRLVAICGAHGTVRPDIVFADSEADLVVRGEFDTALPAAIDAWRANDLKGSSEVCLRGDRIPPPNALGGIDPFRLVDMDARFRMRTAPAQAVRPAYDLIDFADYHGDGYEGVTPHVEHRWATALATRGCAHDCSFCFNFWGRRTRYREPDEVADEIAWLERDHGIRHVFFLDFNFTQKAEWAAQFAEAVRRRNVMLRWSAQTRCDAVTPALLRTMAAAGCEGLWFGVETMDLGVAAQLDKYRDASVVDTAIAESRKAGIRPHLFIMIGLPGETRSSLNSTIREMHRHKAAFCGVMPATPRFGTEHYRLAKEQFSALGNDFYSLRAVRGLVANDLRPADLREALSIMNDRGFVSAAEAPQLPV